MITILPRITARVDIETQELLAQAAAIAGISSIYSFVLNAAFEKAKQIMEREQSLKLSKRDAIMQLVKTLDSPAKDGAVSYYKKLGFTNFMDIPNNLFIAMADVRKIPG